VIPQLASAAAGSVAFTASQRALLAALTANRIPIYDSSKSLLENYSHELVFGSATFFFLPYTSSLADAMLRRAGQAGATRVAHLGAHAAHDVVVFTSVPYIERAILKTAGESHDPIWKGWKDLGTSSAHSLAMGLAFRVRASAVRQAPQLGRVDRERPLHRSLGSP
jgi:hypothetical protein